MADRVADEQLTEWERIAREAEDTTGGVLAWVPVSSLALIADLRESRAREAELLRDHEQYEQDRCDLVNDCARAEVERDGLRQRLQQQRADLSTAYKEAHNATQLAQDLQLRIDKALAELARLEAASRDRMRQPRPNPAAYVTGEHDAYSTALNVARVALTGPTDGPTIAVERFPGPGTPAGPVSDRTGRLGRQGSQNAAGGERQ